jgi:hypothetical protein
MGLAFLRFIELIIYESGTEFNRSNKMFRLFYAKNLPELFFQERLLPQNLQIYKSKVFAGGVQGGRFFQKESPLAAGGKGVT